MTPLLVLAAAVAAVVLPLPAHATIVGTNPTDGSTVQTAPDAFTVTANEEILSIPGGSSNVILITDQAGAYYGTGCTTVDGATLSTEAALGEAGVYSMRYGLVSADGHPIEGVVDFAWEPGPDAAIVPGSAEAPVCGDAQPSATASPTPSAEPTPTTEPSESAPATSDAASPSPSASTPPSDEDGEDDGGLSPFAWIGIGIALAAGIAAAIVIAFRRGRASQRSGEPKEPQDPDAP